MHKTMGLKTNKKGMSFVEVIIAIFIFAIVIFAVMTIFASSFGGYKKADNMAKNIENAQFAMNSMAKSLRTSKIFNQSTFSNEDSLVVYDFSENACKKYTFAENQITLGSQSVTYSDSIDCVAELSSAELSPITDQYVSGSFSGSASSDASLPARMGKVTIKVRVCSDVACPVGKGNDETTLQTTVSLRDYSTVGL